MIAYSQTECGIIQGIVYTFDSTETVPFEIIKIEVEGEIISTKTDFEGEYKIEVSTDVHSLYCESNLFGERTIIGIYVKPNQTTRVDIYLHGFVTGCCGGIPCKWPVPPINRFGEENKLDIKRIDISKVTGTCIIDGIINRSSDFQTNDFNGLIIRGSRAGDVLFIVDGVKTFDAPILPNISVNQVTYYLGGVPAKYGDTTGGVVIIRTQSYFDLYYAWLANQ